MSAAIWYEPDGYRTDGMKLMGRQAAGAGFLNALARFGCEDRLVGAVKTPADGRHFMDIVNPLRPGRPATTIGARDGRALQEIGCLYMPQPLSPQDAWFRHSRGSRAWSLCGVTHTVASHGVMDSVTNWLTAPFRPWDAVVCTSRAVQTSLRRLLDDQAAFLKEQVGATRFPCPALPIIPLGVDCDARKITADDRAAARRACGLDAQDIVILFVGRLSFHAKANPAPMYMALERIAKTRKVCLIECGYPSNERVGMAFAQARDRLCPSVRHIGLDGRDEGRRRTAWAAADIFCSLSDNIQETFGLTPIEAMAAGLPSIVTDWNGYRETVRHGIDGFLVPTCGALPGTGRDLAWDYAAGVDSYDMYVARAALAAAVDVDGVTEALRRLVMDPDLRRSMGDSAARQARAVYDWRHVIKAYEALWTELARRRGAAPEEATRHRMIWPARPDPFAVFAHYPSTHLRSTTGLRLKPDADATMFESRLGLTLAKLDRRTPSLATLLAFRDALDKPNATVETLVRAFPNIRPALVYRTTLLLLKFDLIVTDANRLETPR